MALKPVDWALVKAQARDFVVAHPAVRVLDLTRAERIVLPGARAAFAVVTHNRETPVRELGAVPCCRCGQWTACWCEGCVTHPPTGLCTACDEDHLLCEECVAQGKLYLEVQRQEPADEDTYLEVSGYNDGETFVPLTPPLRVKLEDVPVTADGAFDLEELVKRVRPAGP